MRATRGCLLMAVAAAVFGFVSASAWLGREAPISFSPGDPRDPLPEGWDAEGFLTGIRWVVRHEPRVRRAAPPQGRTNRIEVQLLAWSRQESRRTVRDTYENALAWVRVETAGRGWWIIAWMQRFPLRDDPVWRPVYITDMEWRPFQAFDHPPRNDEIAHFVDGLKPSLDFFGPLDYSFRVVSAAVREHTWRALVGAGSSRSFSAE